MNGVRARAVRLGVAAGLLGVALLGGAAGPVAVVGLLLCLSAPWLAPWVARVPWSVLTLGMLAALGGWVVGGGAPRIGLGLALVYLQVHRALGRSGPGDDRVGLLLAGLMLVASATTTEDPRWLLAWLAWSVALPLTLLPAGLGRVSSALHWMAAALVVSVVLGGLLVYPLMPRLRTDELPSDRALTGFNDTVELGVLGQLLDDPQEVFRVSSGTVPLEGPVYFRGVALDRFDGRTWFTTDQGVRTVTQETVSPQDEVVSLRFEGTPAEGVVFTAGAVRSVEVEGGVVRDRHDAWRLEVPEPDEPVQWTVNAVGPFDTRAAIGASHPPRPGTYLDLPADVDPRITALALRIRGEERDPERIAARIAASLQESFEYTRSPRDVGGEAPLAHFLFERRSGHCEYFASAQAVLLRAVGVPSRMVNGFVGGERDPATGDLIIRRYHAHAWVETWIPDRGWIVVDATPGPGAPASVPWSTQVTERLDAWWQQGVLHFDRSDQQAVLWSAGSVVESVLRRGTPDEASIPWRGLLVLWGAAGLIALGLERWLRWLGRRLAGERRPMPRGPVDRAWDRARMAVEALGHVPPKALPPLSAARWLAGRVTDDGELEQLAWLVYRVRYGGEDPAVLTQEARDLETAIVHRLSVRATG